MKVVIENLNRFIVEQKEYFNYNIKPTYDYAWEDSAWRGGARTSGWLNTTASKVSLNFANTKNLVGFKLLDLSTTYADFCKAMLVCSFRLKNGCSPQALQAELLTLKRWLCILVEETGQDAPYLLSTEVIEKAMTLLKEHCSPANLSDLCNNSVRLQNIINKNVLALLPLNYVNPHKSLNPFNTNKKIKSVKHAKSPGLLDEESRDTEKLISVQTFLNIVALISKVSSNTEKILLYAMMLLITTGFRSAELIMLRCDSLVRREAIDPVTKKPIKINGKIVYYLGIKYHGVKGAGARTHWVEPLAVPLVEAIFKEVMKLTANYRQHIKYLRDNQFKSYLPKSLNRFDGELILLDDFYPTLLGFDCKLRRESSARDKAYIIFAHRGLLPAVETPVDKKRVLRFYKKVDISRYLQTLSPYDNYVLSFNFENSMYNWFVEDMLFIIPLGSSSYRRTLTQLTTFDILSTTLMNTWMGGTSGLQMSVFQKYELKDENGKCSAITTHVPRHNINTFLALTGLSEILQAMLMGRVDVTQNQHYQHLAILELKKAVKTQLATLEEPDSELSPTSPIEACVKDGQMLFSPNLDLEQNLKRNLHTFDGQEDVTQFLSNVTNNDDPFGDEFLTDFKNSLPESNTRTVLESKEALETHAYLFPVLNGSCMRDVRKDGCPSRMKCIAGEGCCNFVVTGRQGELESLTKLRDSLLVSVRKVELLAHNDVRYQRAYLEQRQNLQNIQNVLDKTYRAREKLMPIQVFPDAPNLGNPSGTKHSVSLVDLFAKEQVKLEMAKVGKLKNGE